MRSANVHFDRARSVLDGRVGPVHEPKACEEVEEFEVTKAIVVRWYGMIGSGSAENCIRKKN